MPIIRAFREADDGAPVEAGQGIPLLFTAATSGRKPDGLNLEGLPWDWTRATRSADGAMRYPFLWVHDIGGSRPPLGVADIVPGDKPLPLRVAVTFDPGDPFAVEIERKYRSDVGGLSAVSIQWDDMDADGMPARATKSKPVAHQLWEVSAVPVGMDPDALQDGARAAMRALYDDIGAMLDGRTVGDDVAVAAGADSRGIDGTYEDKIEKLIQAIRNDKLIPGARWVWPVGTDDTSIVVSVSREDGADQYFRLRYTITTGAITFEAPEPVMIEYKTLVKDAPNRGLAENHDDPLAAAMVAVFQVGAWSDEADGERRAAYNGLLPAYRRAGWTAPEFLPLADLRALDDDTWRGLFLSGELQRAGAEFSTKNVSELREIDAALRDASKRLGAMLTRVTAKAEAPLATTGDGGRAGDSEHDLMAAMDRLLSGGNGNG